MKKITYIILAVIIIAVVFFALQGNKESADALKVEGTVTNINLEQAMVDGPYIVTVMTEEGAREIHVPSMGILLCEAKDKIANVSELKVGDVVQASGTLTSEGNIVPCESSKHYLRKQ